jgi:acyl dehydratase
MGRSERVQNPEEVFMDRKAVVEKLQELVGQGVGVSDWVLIDQKRIDQFAECTDDHQWIHVDVEKAAKGLFGKTIAHGFLTLSLISSMSKCIQLPFDKSEVQMSINYGLNKVRFLNPVPVNSKIRTRVTLAAVEEKTPGRVLLTYGHTIETEGQAKPACAAESLAMVFLK